MCLCSVQRGRVCVCVCMCVCVCVCVCVCACMCVCVCVCVCESKNEVTIDDVNGGGKEQLVDLHWLCHHELNQKLAHASPIFDLLKGIRGHDSIVHGACSWHDGDQNEAGTRIFWCSLVSFLNSPIGARDCRAFALLRVKLRSCVARLSWAFERTVDKGPAQATGLLGVTEHRMREYPDTACTSTRTPHAQVPGHRMHRQSNAAEQRALSTRAPTAFLILSASSTPTCRDHMLSVCEYVQPCLAESSSACGSPIDMGIRYFELSHEAMAAASSASARAGGGGIRSEWHLPSPGTHAATSTWKVSARSYTV
jgi:hypothetical protein